MCTPKLLDDGEKIRVASELPDALVLLSHARRTRFPSRKHERVSDDSQMGFPRICDLFGATMEFYRTRWEVCERIGTLSALLDDGMEDEFEVEEPFTT